MAEPDLKKRKIIDPIFEDFRKTGLFDYFQSSVNCFFNSPDNDMKCRFLEIIGPNARSDVSFSKASCTVKTYTGDIFNIKSEVPMSCNLSCLFVDGKVILDKYIDKFHLPCEEKKMKALKKLLYFFSTAYKDFKPKTDDQNECQWAIQLAQQLLSKLAVGSEFVLDHHYSKNAIESRDGKFHCPCDLNDRVEKDIFGDTSFGCAEAWHGSVDILFDDTSVNVSDKPESSRSYVSSDDDSQSSVEVNTGDNFNDREDDQILAQCIVFSFLQRKQLPDSKNFLVPSIAFNRDKVKVTFYDCEHDVLLQTPEIDLFTCNIPNGTTVILLWLVLNYRYFCSGLADPIKEYKANFFERAGDYLAKYRNDVARPVTKVAKNKNDEEGWWKFEGNLNHSNPPTTTDFFDPKEGVEDQDQHTAGGVEGFREIL